MTILWTLSVEALFFVRVAVGVLFAYSAGMKVLALADFRRTLTRLGIPSRMTAPVACVVLVLEGLVTAMVLVGGSVLAVAFALATLLLAAFTAAIWRLLTDGPRVPCNCFGASEKPVGVVEICRNAGFMLCSVTGLTLTWRLGAGPATQWMGSHAGVGLAALAFTVVWSHVGEVIEALGVRTGEAFLSTIRSQEE